MVIATRVKYKDLPEIKLGHYTAYDLAVEMPSAPYDILIVIPCFAEEELLRTLGALNDCDRRDIHYGVIVLINESEQVDPIHQSINENTYHQVVTYASQINGWDLYVRYITDIPHKIAGVGTARKLGMDQAALMMLQRSGYDHQGIILNLDADCTISSDYLKAVYLHFLNNPKDELVSIAFEHRVSELQDADHREAIRQYEAYLHYYIDMQLQLGLPYAFQTIGSAFGVRASAYVQVGGMNRRKAGEDFYFIHKFTKKGTISTLTTCRVYPSGRSSFRVPFGTGKAVADMMMSKPVYLAYDPQGFWDLEVLVDHVRQIYDIGADSLMTQLAGGLRRYLMEEQFQLAMEKIRSNTSSYLSFQKAFFQWFDAFRLMKYLHSIRETDYPPMPIYRAIEKAQMREKY